MRAGSREHGSHVVMLTPLTPLHFGRLSRIKRCSSSMHRAMEEDSLMTRYDDESCNLRDVMNLKTDIITIQETKLTSKNTAKVHNFATVRADRLHKAGGGLITLIRDNIIFTTTYNFDH